MFDTDDTDDTDDSDDTVHMIQKVLLSTFWYFLVHFGTFLGIFGFF